MVERFDLFPDAMIDPVEFGLKPGIIGDTPAHGSSWMRPMARWQRFIAVSCIQRATPISAMPPQFACASFLSCVCLFVSFLFFSFSFHYILFLFFFFSFFFSSFFFF